MKKHLRITIALVLLVSLALTGVATSCTSSSDLSNIAVGGVTDFRARTQPQLDKDIPVPDIEMRMPDGRTIHLYDLKGSAVILNFWGVNCQYCKEEMPFLEQAYAEWSGKGGIIIGINTGDPEQSVKKFMRDYKVNFPVVLDPDLYASMLFGAEYLPTNILIDRNGNAQALKIGPFKNADEISAWFQSVIQ
jgi:peroxiredoxin